MPFDQVFHKFGKGQLHSGGPNGPAVHNPKQAVAIMLSEKQKAEGGDSEYAASKPAPKKKSNALNALKSAVR